MTGTQRLTFFNGVQTRFELVNSVKFLGDKLILWVANQFLVELVGIHYEIKIQYAECEQIDVRARRHNKLVFGLWSDNGQHNF